MNHSDLCFTVSAPGKVILYGEHSVVHDKLAVAASVGLRTYLHFNERVSLDQIVVEIPNVDLTYSIKLMALQEVLQKDLIKDNPLCEPDLVDHIELVTHLQKFISENSTVKLSNQQTLSLTGVFFLLFGILHSVKNLEAFTITVKTDLSLGAGTGSSASFSVAIAATFIYYKHLKSSGTKLEKFSDEDKCLISKWAYCVEKIFHGSPSGIDNSICTYGSIVKFRKSEGMQFIATCEFQLLLVNTKVPRSTKEILNDVFALMQNHSAVTDSIFHTMDLIAESAIKCITSIGSDRNNPTLYCRLQKLTDMNQCMLQSLGVSHPAINQICSVLTKAGLGGKLTGAGRGGYVIAIIPPSISKDVIDNLIEQLNSIGFRAILTKLGGSGVTID